MDHYRKQWEHKGLSWQNYIKALGAFGQDGSEEAVAETHSMQWKQDEILVPRFSWSIWIVGWRGNGLTQSDSGVAIHKTRRNAVSLGLLPFTLSFCPILLCIMLLLRPQTMQKNIAIPMAKTQPWTQVNSEGKRRSRNTVLRRTAMKLVLSARIHIPKPRITAPRIWKSKTKTYIAGLLV